MPKTASDEAHRGRLGPAAIAALTAMYFKSMSLLAEVAGKGGAPLLRPINTAEETLGSPQLHQQMTFLENRGAGPRSHRQPSQKMTHRAGYATFSETVAPPFAS